MSPLSVPSARRGWSLRSRLYLVAGLAVLLAWVGGGAAMLMAASEANDRMCRENLLNLAQTILSFAQHELEEIRADAGGAAPDNVHRETAATLRARYSYQIWSDAGELLLRSVQAPSDRRVAPAGFDGFGKFELDGRQIEVYALRAPAQGMTIVVADHEDDNLLQATFGSYFGLVMVSLLLPVLGGTWLLLRRSLAPLLRTSQELERRGPQVLTPLALGDAPAELVSMIGAINRLMLKVDDALSQERGFTALAAHELRTPLASLRVQAQVVVRSRDPAEQRREVAALQANVDRCTRMLNQMLALARVDALQPGALQLERMALNEVLAEVLADFAALAGERGIEVTCRLEEPGVHADRVLLQMLLRNLLSNALNHTPSQGSIEVCSAPAQGHTLIVVEDSGPGIPDEEQVRVFERFYRRIGERGAGVGLGLAIVAAVARAHVAHISLARSRLGGLAVQLRWPVAPQGQGAPVPAGAGEGGLGVAAD
ncbi:MAG: sensor histidine kinase N-terminal domain-containing protein [Rubrivivax sp.]|nr:sensor histidine kinase N-terminal domain-containing protein [Rubrivivax sp.]